MTKKLLFVAAAFAVLALAVVSPPKQDPQFAAGVSPQFSRSADDGMGPIRALPAVYRYEGELVIDLKVAAGKRSDEKGDVDSGSKKGSTGREQFALAPRHPLLL